MRSCLTGRWRCGGAHNRAYLVAVPAFQAEAILACDFFTADLLDGTQAHVLAVIEHARRIRILGVTLHPTGAWTAQQARNLIMDLGEQAHRVKFMIRDRGSNYAAAFDAVLAGRVMCDSAAGGAGSASALGRRRARSMRVVHRLPGRGVVLA